MNVKSITLAVYLFIAVGAAVWLSNSNLKQSGVAWIIFGAAFVVSGIALSQWMKSPR